MMRGEGPKARARTQRRLRDGWHLESGACTCGASLKGSRLACICKGCSVKGCGGRAPRQCSVYVESGGRCVRLLCLRHGGWSGEVMCPAHLVKLALSESGGHPVLVGDALHRMRMHRGLTQARLAKLAGRSVGTICRFEQGLVGLPPARIGIARALGLETVDPATLWGSP